MGNEASQEGAEAGAMGAGGGMGQAGGGFAPLRGVGPNAAFSMSAQSSPRPPQFSGPVPGPAVLGQSGMPTSFGHPGGMPRPPSSTFLSSTQPAPMSSLPPVNNLPPAAAAAPAPAAATAAAGVPDVDLSHLSAEEQAMIFQVMARAENMEKTPELPIREAEIVPKRTGQQFIRRACPMCHINDIPPNQNDCADCRLKVCHLCGSLMPSPSTKIPEWVCNTCAKRRQQQIKAEAAHQTAEQYSQEHSNDGNKYQSPQYSHQGKSAHQDSRSYNMYQDNSNGHQRNQVGDNGDYDRYRQDGNGMQMTKEGGRVISMISNKPKPATPVVVVPEPAVYSDDEEDNDILESDDSEYENEQRRKVLEIETAELYKTYDKSELLETKEESAHKQRDNNKVMTSTSEKSESANSQSRNPMRESSEITTANLINQMETCMSNGFWDSQEEIMRTNVTLSNNEENINESHVAMSNLEEEQDNYENDTDSSDALPLECFEHNPGEVYTILEEEEDDGLSPNDLKCLKWHRGAVPTYPDPVTMKPKRLGDPPTVVSNQNVLTTKPQGQHMKGDHGPSELRAPQSGRSDTSGVVSSRISESVSPDFASSGAGMAISNMISSSQIHQQHSHSQQTPIRKSQQSSSQSQQSQGMYGPQGVSNGTTGSPNHGNLQKGNVASPPTKMKVKAIDLQSQKKSKSKPDPQDWSPTNDLSPILDVSPSLEAAEQEQMAKYQVQNQLGMGGMQQQFPNQFQNPNMGPGGHNMHMGQGYDGQMTAPSKSATGTISGMLADFSKALGLGSSTQGEKPPSNVNQHPITPAQKQLNQSQQPVYNNQQQFQPGVHQPEHVQRMKLQNVQQQGMMQQQMQPQHQHPMQPLQSQQQPHLQQQQPHLQQQQPHLQQQQPHLQQQQQTHLQQQQQAHLQQQQPHSQQQQPHLQQQQTHLQQQQTHLQQQQQTHLQHQQQAHLQQQQQQQAHLQQQQQAHLQQQQQAHLQQQQQAHLHQQQQANLHQQQTHLQQQQQNVQQQHLQQHNIQQQQHFPPQSVQQQFQQQALQNQQFQHQQQQLLQQQQYQQMVQQHQDHNTHLQGMHHPSQQELLVMQQSGMGQMQGQQQWTIDNGMQDGSYQSGHYPMHQMALQSQTSSGMSGSPKTKPRTVITSAIGVTPVMGVPAGTLIRQSGSPQIGRREQVIAINKGHMSTEVALGNMMMGNVAKPLPAPRLSQQNKVDDTPTTVTAFSHAHVTAAVKAVATMAEKEEQAQSGEHAETSRSLDSPGTPSRRLQSDDHNKRTGEMVGPSLPRPFSPLAAIGTYSCTPSSTPQTPQSQRGGDSDTQSEADSTKSTKVRRRLPPLPADQDLFNPRHHSGSRLGYPIRWDGTTRSRSSLGKYAYLDASRPYSSDSEANLKDIYYGDGSGLKATKSISATNLCGAAGQYDLYTRYDAAGISGSATGRPLTRSALDRYDRPNYSNNQRLPIRKEFDDKYRSAGYKDAKTAQLKRELIAAGILPKNFDMPISTPNQRLRDQSSLKSAHLSQMAMLSKLEQRKRQLSEHQLYGLTRSRTLRNIEKKLNDQKPFKSFEYECIDEGYRNKGLLKKTMTADPILSRPSTSLGALTDPYSSSYDGTNLRDTPIGWSRNNFHLQNYMPDTPSGSLLSSHTYRGPRNINRSLSQEAISWKSDSYKRQALSYLNEDILRAHQNIQGHQRSYKSRSWHPSPSVSEDEDDQFNREEKKQKIKAEIARRRKQIEENVLLHKELIRLAQSRQNAQDTYDSHGSVVRNMLPSKTISGSNTYGYLDDSGYGLEIASLQGSYHRQPHRPLDQSRSMPSISSQDEFKESGSVLRSINEILQNDYSRAPSFDTNYDSPYYSQESVGPLLYNRLQNSRFESHDPFPGGYVGEDLYDPQDLMNSYPMQKTNSSKMSYNRTGSALKRLSAEDKSIDLIASTFAPEYGYAPASARNNYYGASFNRTYYDRSALGTPPDSTPAMPLLPDMPSRSRKLLEDLQYSYGTDGSVISSRPRLQQSQSEDYGSRLGYSNEETDYMEGLSSGIIPRGSSQTNRSLPNPQTVHEPQIRVQPRYPFPVKRIFLTKDYKDKAIGGNGFGLSLIGGKVIPGSNGKLGAFVSKIYHSGVVGTLREVKEGDQVLEWNGIDLTNFTNEEVQACMAQSDSEVEILVKSSEPVKPPRKHLPTNPASHNDNRNTGTKKEPVNSVYYNDDIKDQNNIQKKYSSNNNYNIVSSRNGWGGNDDNNIRRNGDNNIDHLTEVTPSRGRDSTHSKTLPRLPLVSTHEPERVRGKRSKTRTKKDKNAAEIQLQICYDIKAQILYVSTLQARNLLSNRTSDDKVPDPFVTCQLLPGRNVENQRKTRYVSRNSNPEWKQTMVYPNIPPEELKKRYLELTIWNFDSSQQNEFMGEVLVDLSTPTTFNEDPRWYPLKEHQECQIRNLECTTTVPTHAPAGLNRRDNTSHARQVPPTPTNRRGQVPRSYNDEIERNSGEVGLKMMK